MSVFHSEGHTYIRGGLFNLINGTQINHYHSQSSSERRLVQIQPGEEWKEILYQEYEPIPSGRIKLLKTLHHESRDPPMDAWRRRYIKASEQEGRPEAERVVEIATIADPNGRDESDPLLAVRYTGRDALKLFKEDCILFSHQRMTTMAQLRAFNDSRLIPAIIFNEELVSAYHFLKHNQFSVVARCYLHFHMVVWVLFRRASARNEYEFWRLLTASTDDLLDCFWFRPQTGTLCLGPPGPNLLSDSSPNTHISLPLLEPPVRRSSCLELPPLPFDACHDSTTLSNYIERNVPERSVVLEVSVIASHRGHGPFHRGIRHWKEELINDRWTPWGELIPKRVLEIPFHEWTHSLGNDFHGRTPSAQDPTESSETRFPFSRRLRVVTFDFTEPLTEDRVSPREELWLTQAGWVFSRLRISRRDWASCSIVTGIELMLVSRELFEPEDSYEDLVPPYYLCVPPPPRLPDGAPDIETWLRGENLYYYSCDAEGGSAITEGERISLGLPAFTSEFYVKYAYWNTNAYDFMEQWQRAKGYDYSTIDYARSLGFPTLEVTIPQNRGRFEDLIDSPDAMEMDIDSGMNDQMDFTPIDHDSSSSDMEVDVDT
ncbi:hypothetical protein PM082_016789 [Marasmius tenuissimus]|nr:hypothetical protein PM082_016789 [Marasmius tenuissimus]